MSLMDEAAVFRVLRNAPNQQIVMEILDEEGRVLEKLRFEKHVAEDLIQQIQIQLDAMGPPAA